MIRNKRLGVRSMFPRTFASVPANILLCSSDVRGMFAPRFRTFALSGNSQHKHGRRRRRRRRGGGGSIRRREEGEKKEEEQEQELWKIVVGNFFR